MAESPEAALAPRAVSPLTIAWCLFSGVVLVLVPAEPNLWARVLGAHEALRRIADMDAARLGVAGFGLLLLLVATSDLVSTFAGRHSG